MTKFTESFQGLRVLMADDETESIKPFGDLLAESGMIVTYVSTLDEAIGKLKAGNAPPPFDLAILDLRFNNGLPAELNDYAENKKDYITFGAALASWMDDRLKDNPLPYIFYTIFPKRTPPESTALDKIDPISKVAEQLAAFVQQNIGGR